MYVTPVSSKDFYVSRISKFSVFEKTVTAKNFTLRA